MSHKETNYEEKDGWTPSNTNGSDDSDESDNSDDSDSSGNSDDSDDSESSSDSDGTVQPTHNLSRSESSDSSPTHKSQQGGVVGSPPAHSCDPPHTPDLPVKPSSTNAVTVNSLTSSNDDLSPNARVQPSSSSQADPVVDDNSSEVQFIMELPPSGRSNTMPHFSDYMRSIKRRRMHFGTLGNTNVSDEVIVVDDDHQEQNGSLSQSSFKAFMHGTSSHRKSKPISAMNSVVLPSCSSAVSSTAKPPGHNVQTQTDNTTPISYLELTTSRDLSDGNVVNPERSVSPDSVVEIPLVTALLANSASSVNGAPVPSLNTVTMNDGTTEPVAGAGLERDSGVSAGVSSVKAVSGLVESSTSEQAIRGPVIVRTGQPRLLDAVNTRERSPLGNRNDASSAVDKQALDNPDEEVMKQLKKIAAYKDINDRLRAMISLMKCAACLEYIGAPIFQCRRGHIVCCNCKTNRMCCPTCCANITDSRNLVAERFSEKLEFPCKNAHLGCERKFFLVDLKNHEISDCGFRQVECNLCPWKGLCGELNTHMGNDHPNSLSTTQDNGPQS